MSLNNSLPAYSNNITDVNGDVTTSSIDIISVSREGSTIVISTADSVGILGSGEIASYFILFDQDSDNNFWDAAIVYTISNSGTSIVHWTIDDMTFYFDWRSELDSNSMYQSGTTINARFNEFSDVDVADYIVVSIAFKENTDTLVVDWAPDAYKNKVLTSDLLKIRPIESFGTSESKISTTTTTSTTSPTSTTTTTTSSEPPTQSTTSSNLPSDDSSIDSESSKQSETTQSDSNNISDSEPPSSSPSISSTNYISFGLVMFSLLFILFRRRFA